MVGSVSQTFPSLTGLEQVRLCAFPPSSLSEDATFLCGAASVPDDTAALLSVELLQKEQKMLWLTLHFFRRRRLYRHCWAILTLLLVCVGPYVVLYDDHEEEFKLPALLIWDCISLSLSSLKPQSAP